MSLPLIVRPRAQVDMDAAFDWYEEQAGRGADFAAHVEEALDRIRAAPLAYATVLKNVRRASVSVYPYGIFYRVRSKKVIVIAVVHDHRDPAVWQRRV